MVRNEIALKVLRTLRSGEPNEFARYIPALVQKLVKAMLSISSRLSKVHHCALIRQNFSFDIYSLSITLHIELLNVRNKLAESLAIRQNRSCIIVCDGSIVKAD